MTQEEKQLLLADLCARLPYGVKVAIEYSEGKYTHIYDLRKIDNDTTSELRQRVSVWNYGLYNTVISYPLMDCKPYLRPMSSMTKEEVDTFMEILSDVRKEVQDDALLSTYKVFDFCNAKHLDYRGLIKRGLAIEVTEENNPYIE